MEKYNYLIEWSGDNYEKKGGAPFFFYCKEFIFVNYCENMNSRNSSFILLFPNTSSDAYGILNIAKKMFYQSL